jgi:hypothetical protein
VDDFEEPGVAVLVLDVAACAPLVRLVGRVRTLGRLLRTHPRGPRLPFHAVDLLDLDLACQVEVADGRLQPPVLNLLQVEADRRLLDPDFSRDRTLRPALEVQIRDPILALAHGNALGPADGHL